MSCFTSTCSNLPKLRSSYRNVIQITYVPSSYATSSTKYKAVCTFSKYILENNNNHVTYQGYGYMFRALLVTMVKPFTEYGYLERSNHFVC